MLDYGTAIVGEGQLTLPVILKQNHIAAGNETGLTWEIPKLLRNFDGRVALSCGRVRKVHRRGGFVTRP